MTITAERLGWTKLTCVACNTEHTTAMRHWKGTPIRQWWAERGSRCKRCIDLAELANPKPKPARTVAPMQLPTSPPATIEEHFHVFHANNPVVYSSLVDEGRELLRRGHRKLGIGMLYERLRWQVMMATHDDQVDFKLPNNYRSYYARLIMAQEADFEGVFNLAELRSART